MYGKFREKSRRNRREFKVLTVSFKNEKTKKWFTMFRIWKQESMDFEKIKTEEYKIVIEATGSYSSKILHYASSLGFDVYQISPLTIKKICGSKNVISKTDDEVAKLIRILEKMEMSLYKFSFQKRKSWISGSRIESFTGFGNRKKQFFEIKSLRQRRDWTKTWLNITNPLIKGIEKTSKNFWKDCRIGRWKELKDNKNCSQKHSGIGKTSLITGCKRTILWFWTSEIE